MAIVTTPTTQVDIKLGDKQMMESEYQPSIGIVEHTIIPMTADKDRQDIKIEGLCH